MAKIKGPTLQPYPRQGTSLLSDSTLFPLLHPPMDESVISAAIRTAFERCLRDKKGRLKRNIDSPRALVDLTIKHLQERSDPVLTSYFVGQIEIEDLFDFDAVSYEMQRHRMTIGVFYQYLILELMKHRWNVFDASREGDIVADISTPGFEPGLRLYFSVINSRVINKKQKIGDEIRRLESLASKEKDVIRPYICVIVNSTPSERFIKKHNERRIKCNRNGIQYSLNSEYWESDFTIRFLTGRSPVEIYINVIKQIKSYLPLKSIEYREEGSLLLKQKLEERKLLNPNGKIDPFRLLTIYSRNDK